MENGEGENTSAQDGGKRMALLKRIILLIAGVLVAVFIVLQFFQIDKTMPPINERDTLAATVSVPPDVAAILDRSCSDCHSDRTVYPWYANIQPVAWFLKDHIDHGRQHLNFSIYNTYQATRKAKRLDDICEQVQAREMPLASYLWIHREAVLSDADVTRLCDWASAERLKLPE